MLYISGVPAQAAVAPVMAPGVAGVVDTVTPLNVDGLLVPQKLVAVTVISPPVAPMVASMEAVVEIPVHPDGKVHV